MSYFPDSGPCDYFDGRPGLVAVGWLEAGFEFPVGDVSAASLEKLEVLLHTSWQETWTSFLGWHECSLCNQARGSKNLFITGISCVYVAPELILHYIKAHGYKPPGDFLQAVEECPPQDSQNYFLALRSAGLDPTNWWVPTCFGNSESGVSPEDHKRAVENEVSRLSLKYFPEEHRSATAGLYAEADPGSGPGV